MNKEDPLNKKLREYYIKRLEIMVLQEDIEKLQSDILGLVNKSKKFNINGSSIKIFRNKTQRIWKYEELYSFLKNKLNGKIADSVVIHSKVDTKKLDVLLDRKILLEDDISPFYEFRKIKPFMSFRK